MEGGPSVAKALTHEKWDLIIFTGSSDKGKKVAAAAGANLVPVILELGCNLREPRLYHCS